jgi:hypothetical protein
VHHWVALPDSEFIGPPLLASPDFGLRTGYFSDFVFVSFKQLKLTASGQAFSQRQREVGHPTPFTPFAYSFGVLASIL